MRQRMARERRLYDRTSGQACLAIKIMQLIVISSVILVSAYMAFHG